MALKCSNYNLLRRLGERADAKQKFIPDGDSDFARNAWSFAQVIVCDPARFHLSADDARRIETAVQAFRDALAKSLHRFTRSMQTTMRKDEARARAVAIVRKYGNLIRVNDEISATDKSMLRINERPKRLKKTRCPRTAPHLEFVGTTGENGGLGHEHILKFCDAPLVGSRRPRAPGATRLELFVELVPPGEPIPAHPRELSGGRLWYLRSFTRSPMHVGFPVPDRPMRVVYWARWADSTGNVGPFCATVVARLEGLESHVPAVALPGPDRARQQRIVITSAMKELPDCRVAVNDADVDESRLLRS